MKISIIPKILICLIFIFNAIDTYLSVVYIANEGIVEEMNPIMSICISKSLFLFILIKILGVPTILGFFYNNFSYLFAKIAFYVSFLAYAIVMYAWFHILF